jgi:hypothetical protein
MQQTYVETYDHAKHEFSPFYPNSTLPSQARSRSSHRTPDGRRHIESPPNTVHGHGHGHLCFRPHPSAPPHVAANASAGIAGSDDGEAEGGQAPPSRVRLRAPGGPVPPLPPPALRPRPRGHRPATAHSDPGKGKERPPAAGVPARELPRGLVLGGALAALLLARWILLLRPQPPSAGS